MGPRRVVLFCLYLLNEPVTLLWTPLLRRLSRKLLGSTGGGVRGWSRCKQTLNQERKRAPVAEKVAEKIKMKSCFSCCLMPGPGNVPCDVCNVREQRAFKSCLVCLWFLVSRMSHFCFPMCFLRSRFIYSVQKTSLFLTRVRPRDFFAAVDHTSMYHLSSLYMPRKQTKSP